MKIKAKKLFFRVLIFSACLLFTSTVVLAATDDFTADGDISVSGVTFGDTTADMIILSGSKSESWEFNSGTFTVANPDSAFKIGSSDSAVKGLKAVRGTNEYCENNTTPGTSYLTLPTTAGTYTITPLSGTCVGGSPSSVPAPSAGSGSGGTGETTLGGTSNLGNVSSSGKNVFMYINSTANFTTTVSGSGSNSHSVKVTGLDLTNKQITLTFQSDPVTVELNLKETKEVDLNGDGLSDVKVTFNDLIINKADLTITNILSTSKAFALGLVAGDLIKIATNSAVYYIDSNGKRHLFVNAATFWTWYSGSWSKIKYGTEAKTIKIISQADFDQVLLGANITAKPANKLIKFRTSKRVYVVDEGAILRQVVSSSGDASVAKKLYGADYAKNVILVPDGFESDYTHGEVLTETSTAPIKTLEINKLF
ncbi:MAG: hypothetical protein WC518_01195 [Patescibacteria group bacterium]